MTEAEWDACDDPALMLPSLQGKASERKLRLFAVACCRRIPQLAALREIALVERVVEGVSTIAELVEAHNEAVRGSEQWLGQFSYVPPPAPLPGDGAALALTSTPMTATDTNVCANAAAFMAPEEPPRQAQLLRDIFHPFAPDTPDRAWLTPTVRGLAETIYQERAFDRLPILADALEDAGCTNADILNHCRQPGEHIRGCWVIDRLTGRQ